MNDKLPEEITDQINNEADKYGFVVPYDGSNKFYNDDKVKGYQAGATAWAPWKVRYDELKTLLDKQLTTEQELLKAAEVSQALLQRVADALDYIANTAQMDGYVLKNVARKSLQQFKDGTKGVTNPCPHCGKELSRDRNLCCRACGKEVVDE